MGSTAPPHIVGSSYRVYRATASHTPRYRATAGYRYRATALPRDTDTAATAGLRYHTAVALARRSGIPSCSSLEVFLPQDLLRSNVDLHIVST